MQPAGPDHELMAAATAGGEGAERAFEEFYRRHLALVYAAAASVVKRRDLAEEVAQDTFVEAHREAARLAEVANVRGWLYQAARHNALDRLRRLRVRPDLSRGDAALSTVADTRAAADPEASAAREALRERVLSVIATLPAAQRDAATLCLVAGLSSQEAASATDSSEGAVRVNLHYARLKLRAALAAVAGAVP